MKFLEKVKNMFTEEVEEEVKPIKTEVRKVEIPSPVKQTIKEEQQSSSVEEKISESEALKKEEKPKAPVFFDDKDFDKLPAASAIEKKTERKREEKPVLKNTIKEPLRKEAYGGKNPALSANIIKEEKRFFKPTPIISPVYGVLDKNYKKDDITPKKKIVEPKRNKPLTVDDIRNKAFGTLEDDLETTLFGKDSILFDNDDIVESKEEETLDLFDELDFKVENSNYEKIDEKVTPSRVAKNKELELLNEVEDLGNLIVNERPSLDLISENDDNKKIETSIRKEKMNDNMIEDEMDKIFSEKNEESESELTESDLFSLIDSMYEKKEGEE